MSPTSAVGVTTPGVYSQIPQDVGRLVDPAPIRVAMISMGTVQSTQDTFTLRDNIGDGTNDSRTFIMRPACYQQLSASEFMLFEKQTQGKKPPTKDDQPSEIWWPTANPNMSVVNLMWILQNLADIIPKTKRLRVRDLIATWETSLRIWDGVENTSSRWNLHWPLSCPTLS